LPVGIEDFQEIRRLGFYYVDKTMLIEQLLAKWGKVNLFTRPRRFGKSLNMSMLRYFFDIETDKTLFDGLYISRNKQLCEEYMGKFPVIVLSLKGVDGLTFSEARFCLAELIESEARRFKFLMHSDNLDADDKAMYRDLLSLHGADVAVISLRFALKKLSELLYKHYGKKTLILIDEYDVPLDKAFQHGYYREMVALIRGLFGETLKTNEFIQFAVLTGCLRVSKESIFTGLNNFKVLSITDARFDEQFGFTDAEVQQLLHVYNLEEHLAETKEWYDGYRFGEVDVYCPWDVINHVDRLLGQPDAEPQAYWINTSGNELVKRFINKANKTTRDEIERLVSGESIEKHVRLELTYDEIDNGIDNLWSVLFTTGYLTQAGMTARGAYKLVIPNREIREVYKLQIQEWFKDAVLSNTEQLTACWSAFKAGDAEVIEKYLNNMLSNSISVFDLKAAEKENVYHTFLVGLLAGNSGWLVKSNVEAGEGFADIIVETEDADAGMILELKYAREAAGLAKACEKALAQIKERRYAEYLKNEGRNQMLFYGIAFYKKRCRVVVEKL
ncbi:AAA family ATPase, partial [Phascolarctobacterium succinatutens]|uniref:AAA family ATPase n=1 Tax=Phascolarctobacterium succinatutens TaxID=626940 RepID=UPI0026F24990